MTLIVYMQQWGQSLELLEMSRATTVGAKVTMHVTAQILQSALTVGRVAILQRIVGRKILQRSHHQREHQRRKQQPDQKRRPSLEPRAKARPKVVEKEVNSEKLKAKSLKKLRKLKSQNKSRKMVTRRP